MKKYLYWRFTNHLQKKYREYFEEWFSNITKEQLLYFKKEKENLTLKGIYKNAD